MTTRSVRGTASALILRTTPSGADTGKRLIAGQVATSHGETWDEDWQFVVAPAGAGWASAAYLQPAPSPAPAAPVPAKRLLYTLEGEDPELTAKIDLVREDARAEGIEFTTADFGGVRTKADTIEIMGYRDNDYAVYVRNLKKKNPNARPVPMQRWRPINAFGTSWHNFGAARDLKITKHPPSFSESKALARVGALAKKRGLVYGGDFTRPDPPHVQLNITLAQARQRYEARRAT